MVDKTAMTLTCKCGMFVTHGICWHTGYDPHKSIGHQVVNATIQSANANNVLRASRTLPDAYKRRADFLDLCEEIKPGSSGLSGEWH